MTYEGFDHEVQLTLENPFQLVEGEAYPVIGQSGLGKVVSPDSLASVPRSHHALSLF